MPSSPGLLDDVRSAEEKAKDYKFSELVSSPAPVTWTNKKTYRKYPIYNQNGSGSCVSQTLRKLYGVYIQEKTGTYVDLSASHIYQRRRNRPEGGMSGNDAFEIARKGTTLEAFAPSEKKTDAEMDATAVLPFMEEVGKVFKLGNYVELDQRDIDTIASVIQTTGKGVMLWFYFTYQEWGNVPKIINQLLPSSGNGVIRHSVAAVDFTLYNGQKALVIDDSWGNETALEGQRIITQDFFDKRCFYGAYFTNFAFEQTTAKPKYDGTTKSLQDCLKSEGLFPSNVESTGTIGPVTIKAINAFQVKYGLHPTGTGTVGPKTDAKLRELYP